MRQAQAKFQARLVLARRGEFYTRHVKACHGWRQAKGKLQANVCVCVCACLYTFTHIEISKNKNVYVHGSVVIVQLERCFARRAHSAGRAGA